jgi:drug/metabolite transporter (DMT)-like permease
MKTIIGIALLAGGVALLVFGFQAKGSMDNKFAETFQGAPKEKTTWLLAGGAAASAAGALLIVLRDRKSK